MHSKVFITCSSSCPNAFVPLLPKHQYIVFALTSWVCTCEDIDVLTSSSNYEVINEIDRLSSPLITTVWWRFSSRHGFFLMEKQSSFHLFHFRSPSMHAASQQIWWWSIASRQEPHSSLVLVAMDSSRTQSSSPTPGGVYLLASAMLAWALLLCPLIEFFFFLVVCSSLSLIHTQALKCSFWVFFWALHASHYCWRYKAAVSIHFIGNSV